MKQQIFAIAALVLASGVLPAIALAQTAAAPAAAQPGAATSGHWYCCKGPDGTTTPNGIGIT